MASDVLSIVRLSNAAMRFERLPDGSCAFYDGGRETVFSLNETAYAAYCACEKPSDLASVRKGMSWRLNVVVPEEVALQAVAELEAVGLVSRSTPQTTPGAESRRAVLQAFAKASGYAIPAAFALRSSEQKVFAQEAGSGTTTTSTTTTTAAPIEATVVPNCFEATDGSFTPSFTVTVPGITLAPTTTVTLSPGLTVGIAFPMPPSSLSVIVMGIGAYRTNGGTSFTITLTNPGEPTAVATVSLVNCGG
jgi:hypothetical protein